MLDGHCRKCRKRKNCKVPCAFVDEILKADGNQIYERADTETVTVYPPWKEVQESVVRDSLNQELPESGQIEGEMFSDETESPWMSTDWKLDRTHVFILRVFKRWSWHDIAIAVDDDPERVRKLYKDATKRLLKALEVLDARRAIIDDAEARLAISEKATGKMPKIYKWFLLNKVFGLLPREIAEMYDAKIKTVCARIRDVADRVMVGNINFLDATPEQIEKAQERIEKKKVADKRGKAIRKAQRKMTEMENAN